MEQDPGVLPVPGTSQQSLLSCCPGTHPSAPVLPWLSCADPDKGAAFWLEPREMGEH